MPYKISVSASAAVKLANTSKEKRSALNLNSEATGGVAKSKSQQKELEAARKDGHIPALKDEDGKDINPHTPLFVMQTPWYFDSLKPTLRHQAKLLPDKEYSPIDKWYKRGTSGQRALKYKKGSCENCGSMTHKKSECFERPRALGAKFTNQDIAENDNLIEEKMHLNYDGKRDRWNNYDVAEHMNIQDTYAKIEDEQNRLKSNAIQKTVTDQETDESGEVKYDESVDAGVDQKVDSKQRITVRNLRIREDTAKYLYNLDLNSAYYDPVSRSMRENPFEGKDIEFEEMPHRGDNVYYKSKEMDDFLKKQVFSWNCEKDETTKDQVNLQALPTITEYEYKKSLSTDSEKQEQRNKDLLKRYGGEEYTKQPQPGIYSSAKYTEFSQSGQKINDDVKIKVTSKYLEDIYPNNHTEIFGSYHCDGKWGYKCCYSTLKNSYCGGLASKIATQKSRNQTHLANSSQNNMVK
ncbi:MAG: mRNA splicing protein [Marteilia pararefringens]